MIIIAGNCFIIYYCHVLSIVVIICSIIAYYCYLPLLSLLVFYCLFLVLFLVLTTDISFNHSYLYLSTIIVAIIGMLVLLAIV